MQQTREKRIQSLGWEDTLVKGMATSSVFYIEEFHGQRSLASYSPHNPKESDMTEMTEYACNRQLKCLWASLLAQTVNNL